MITNNSRLDVPHDLLVGEPVAVARGLGFVSARRQADAFPQERTTTGVAAAVILIA